MYVSFGKAVPATAKNLADFEARRNAPLNASVENLPSVEPQRETAARRVDAFIEGRGAGRPGEEVEQLLTDLLGNVLKELQGLDQAEGDERIA